MNSVNDGLPFGLTGKKRVSIYTEARISQEVFIRSSAGDTACAVCTTEKGDSEKRVRKRSARHTPRCQFRTIGC